MSNLHEMVINDIGKVIGREAVALDDDEVVLALILSVSSIHKIGRRDGGFGGFESNGMWLAMRCSSVGFRLANVRTSPRVVSCAAAGGGFPDVELQILFGTEAAECPVTVQKGLCMLLIQRETFGLWGVSATYA